MPAIRSLMFVPGDSERKISKGLGSGADALILDLEDAVAPERKDAARDMCREALEAASSGSGGPALFVRVNALGTPQFAADLAAVVRGRPFGIMLPKCQSARDLMRVADMLDVLEERDGIEAGRTLLLPLVSETGASMLGFSTYSEFQIPRLFGMTWGGEDLAADLGARTNRDESGAYAHPYQLARTMCLCAAAATGTVAVDAVFVDIRDEAGLQREAVTASKAGFTGKMAIHPAQVPVINAAFTPDEDDIAQARRTLAAFEGAGATGVAVLDGRMLDRPHQRAAMRILAGVA